MELNAYRSVYAIFRYGPAVVLEELQIVLLVKFGINKPDELLLRTDLLSPFDNNIY